MVRNLTVALITITKGVKVTQVVAANAVPQVEGLLETLEKLDEIQGVQQTRMSVEGGRRCSSSSLAYLAWRGGLTEIKQLPESCY